MLPGTAHGRVRTVCIILAGNYERDRLFGRGRRTEEYMGEWLMAESWRDNKGLISFRIGVTGLAMRL
jgi:hypothetical protein